MREKIRGIWCRSNWADYERRVKEFAFALTRLGFRRGDRLAIASEDTPEWLIADLAVQSLGGVSVGIYPTNPWPELQYIVRHSQCRFVVCGDQEQVDKVLDASKAGRRPAAARADHLRRHEGHASLLRPAPDRVGGRCSSGSGMPTRPT